MTKTTKKATTSKPKKAVESTAKNCAANYVKESFPRLVYAALDEARAVLPPDESLQSHANILRGKSGLSKRLPMVLMTPEFIAGFAALILEYSESLLAASAQEGADIATRIEKIAEEKRGIFAWFAEMQIETAAAMPQLLKNERFGYDQLAAAIDFDGKLRRKLETKELEQCNKLAMRFAKYIAIEAARFIVASAPARPKLSVALLILLCNERNISPSIKEKIVALYRDAITAKQAQVKKGAERKKTSEKKSAKKSGKKSGEDGGEDGSGAEKKKSRGKKASVAANRKAKKSGKAEEAEEAEESDEDEEAEESGEEAEESGEEEEAEESGDEPEESGDEDESGEAEEDGAEKSSKSPSKAGAKAKSV